VSKRAWDGPSTTIPTDLLQGSGTFRDRASLFPKVVLNFRGVTRSIIFAGDQIGLSPHVKDVSKKSLSYPVAIKLIAVVIPDGAPRDSIWPLVSNGSANRPERTSRRIWHTWTACPRRVMICTMSGRIITAPRFPIVSKNECWGYQQTKQRQTDNLSHLSSSCVR
jgi:hypothetical protein